MQERHPHPHPHGGQHDPTSGEMYPPEYNMNFMRPPMWNPHQLDSDHINTDKFDRININNINFSNYKKLMNF